MVREFGFFFWFLLDLPKIANIHVFVLDWVEVSGEACSSGGIVGACVA